MAPRNKMFLSGEWNAFSLRKTVGDWVVFDFQLTLVDDGDGGELTCLFRNIDGLALDDLRLTRHLSLEIKRRTDPWPSDMLFEISDLEAGAMDFICARVDINGLEF